MLPPVTTRIDEEVHAFNPFTKTHVIADDSPIAIYPDFAYFASTHPWAGSRIGVPVALEEGMSQEYQATTAYGVFGEKQPKEVHGAIRERYRQLGGPDGWLGYPSTDETSTPDGAGRFNHFANGSIYWHPATGAFEVHGMIRSKWQELGWEMSWLGYPTSDEQEFENGRASKFQHGAIYWWPDTGAIAINDVIVQYTGLHCFGETDASGLDGSDQPIATIGINRPDGNNQVFNTQIYSEVNGGDSRFDLIEIYRGQPHGLLINTVLVEHGGGKDVVAAARSLADEAIVKGTPLLAKAALAVPYFGPILGPGVEIAVPLIKKDLLDLVGEFFGSTLGFDDRSLGSDVIGLSARQMILLAVRTEGHVMFGPIPWRFETTLMSRFGASYKMYFNVFPA